MGAATSWNFMMPAFRASMLCSFDIPALHVLYSDYVKRRPHVSMAVAPSGCKRHLETPARFCAELLTELNVRLGAGTHMSHLVSSSDTGNTRSCAGA